MENNVRSSFNRNDNILVSLLCKSVKVFLVAFVAVESAKTTIRHNTKHRVKAENGLINYPSHLHGQYFVQSPPVRLEHLQSSITQTPTPHSFDKHRFYNPFHGGQHWITKNEHDLPQIVPGMPNFVELQPENLNQRRQGESSHTEEGGEKGKEEKVPSSESVHDETGLDINMSPFEEAIKNLTTPEQLVPIINDLTLITLIVLHLPAIVPAILIPLAFYGVGALLIPIVRVNYFINHKDDGEDGRYLNSATEVLNFFYEKLWLW